MAKTAFPLPLSKGSSGKRFVALLIAAGILLLIINDPAGAAHLLKTVCTSVVTFVRSLRG
jgi:hypothetical protein